MMESVAIVGPGRVGQALGRLLTRAGVRVESVAARRRSAALRAVRFIRAGRATSLGDPKLAQAQVVLITTSDSAIPRVASGLVSMRANWRGKIVLHTCGSLPSDGGDLRRLRRLGASVGCLHPFETVPTPEIGLRNLRGCTWAVEGDPAARRVARRWVRRLGGRVVQIRPTRKALYHLSAFLVCPSVVTLMDRSLRLLRGAGVPAAIGRRMLARILSSSARNVTELGARRALTGPAVRGDWATIRRHLEALRQFSPDLIPAYLGLLRPMARLGGKRVPGLPRRRGQHGSFTRRGSGGE